MDRFQRNTIKSFKKVKKDILELKEQITRVILNQEEIMQNLKKVDNKAPASKRKR
jgi:hypothetical protein